MRRFGERTRVGAQVSTWTPAPTFQPGSISGLALWLDASDLTTITESSGAVSQWNDKSGNARHVSQGTAAQQPTTGSSTLNGLNVISFDGSNDNLRTSNGALELATLTCVALIRSNTTFRSMLGVSQAATTHTSPFWRWTIFHDGSQTMSIRLNGTNSAAAAPPGTDVPRILILDSGVGDLWVNGMRTVDAAGVTLTYPNSTPLIIGTTPVSDFALNGYVAEIAIYDKSLSATERTLISNYLINKWSPI